MKKTLRNILFVTALSPLLMQCASQDEVQRLQYQLHVVNKKLAEMQNSTVGDIQKRQAASSNQMDQLEREILTLKGQLEETNLQNRNLSAQNEALQSNIGNVAKEEAQRREEAMRRIEEEQRAKEALIVELNEKLKAQQESLQAIQDSRVKEAERRAQEARAKADAARVRAMSATPSSSSSGADGVVRITSDQGKRVVGSASQPIASPPMEQPPEVQPQAAPEVSQPVAAATPKPAAAQPAAPKAAAPEQPKPEPAASAPSSGSALAEADQLFQQKQYSKAYSEYEKVAMATLLVIRALRQGI